MAYAKTVKELITNLFNQNKGGIISNETYEEFMNVFPSLTEEEGIIFNRQRQEWQDETYFSLGSFVNEMRMLFNPYDKEEFLNGFTSEDIFLGPPNENITITPEELNGNIIINLGNFYSSGSNISYNYSDFCKFYYNFDSRWYEGDGGPFKKFSGTGNALYVLPFAENNAYIANRPFFSPFIVPTYFSSIIPLTQTSQLANLNIYCAMEETYEAEKIYFIKNNEAETYTGFKVYNKNKLFKMFLLFGITHYYTNIQNLQNDVYVLIEVEPDEPSEIPPGQEKNQIFNNFGEGNFESDVISYPINAITGVGTGITTYILNHEQMQYILNKVWDPSLIAILTNFDLSPIVNCLIWPCEMTSTIEGTTAQSVGVYIGKNIIPFSSLDPKINYYITKNYIKILDFGEIEMKSKNFYNSFLDYEPYSTYNLYLPYVGIVPIAACDVINHKVRINCCLDIATGAGKYIILIDGTGKYFFDCQVGIQIQLTNSNFSESLNGLVRNSINPISNFREGGAVGVISKGLGNAASALNNIDFSSIGTSGNGNERLNSQEAYFIIERCETVIPTDFNKNYGRPSLITTQLKNLKGFTTVPNVLIETTATETEKKEIIALLNEGVIIK